MRSSPSLESVAEYASYVSQPYTLARPDGPQVINGVNISPDFFKAFRVRPASGRPFTADDENVAQPAVCLVTAAGARRLFNGQRDVIGRTLSFVEGQVTVIGVMDDRFWYPMAPAANADQGEATPDLLLPLARLGALGGPDSLHVVAARAYWPQEDPIGRRITVNQKWPVRIIGVVGDLREANERQAPGPSVYLPLNPFSTRFYRARTMVVRTSQPRAGRGQDAIRALAAVDPRLPVTMARADETLSERRQDPRFYAVFVGLVAVSGLLLGIALVAALVPAHRAARINPVEALRAE